MNLTAYPDSDSGDEAPPAPKVPAHRIVDRSDSGRIKLNLPAASLSSSVNNNQDDAPPAKKARIRGGGAFSGFNSMLPAPKKPLAKAPTAPENGKRGLGSGLGVGVNLKTGAEPAFQRDTSRAEVDASDENGNPIKKQPLNKSDFRALLNLPPPKTETKTSSPTALPADTLLTKPQQAPKLAAPRFVPMSVGKGKKKAKPLPPRTAVATVQVPTTFTAAVPTPIAEPKPTPKPKVSLFGVSQVAPTTVQTFSDDNYQPFLAEAENAPVAGEDTEMQLDSFAAPHVSVPRPSANNLTNVASELNLSEAERRQLFGKKGRGGPDWSSANIVEFNTDAEYAHNEQLRQLGEQVQHNPLKSFSGAGKNSLRTLVNQASSQKDALEDHFATGHRNKKEAGNRYGW